MHDLVVCTFQDTLEEALVATHQEMEMYRSQAMSSDKLQMKKETLQSQLINIRGELSQASSVRTGGMHCLRTGGNGEHIILDRKKKSEARERMRIELDFNQ